MNRRFSNPARNSNPPSAKPRASASFAARRRVLSQWRGQDFRPLEEARAIRAKSIGALVPSVLSSLRLDNRRAEAEVVKVWNNLLDPNIIAHAQPTGLRKGTLFVTVDNHAWHCEIVRYRYPEILKQLQYSFGRQLIARISFRVG
jgi:Dna[CI] antecedent, DciA